MDDYKELNEILVRLFRSIMDVEEKAIITREFQDITNNDMHVIEAIGIGTPKNMSSIAKKLSVTVGTLTIAMNSLVKKGYVKRERGEEDRRVVYISLSDKGKKAFVHHARFHKEMITSIMDEFDDDEKKILIRVSRNWIIGLRIRKKRIKRIESRNDRLPALDKMCKRQMFFKRISAFLSMRAMGAL